MKYLIWSNEHAGWWKPNHRGYTEIISQAGRYYREEAEHICKQANRHRPEGAEPHEVMVLAPEADGRSREEREVFVVLTNSDRTEGRGYPVVIAVCHSLATAQRLGKKKGVMNYDADILRATAVRPKDGPTTWLVPGFITPPSQEDEVAEKARTAKEEALAAARAAGLSDDHIASLSAQEPRA